MSELEKYYNKNYYSEGMPEFKDITPEFKKAIENSLGFANFKFVNAFKELAESSTNPILKIFKTK